MTYTDTDIAQINHDLEPADPKSILKFAYESFGDNLAVVTSFQPTGIVTLHMLHELKASVSVLTLDTGMLFPETYALIDQVEHLFDLRLKRIRPELTIEQQEAQHGPALWGSNPDMCCNLRKTAPLGPALHGYDAWIAGLRRDQPGRESVGIFSWDKKCRKVKVAPFANWTEDMIWAYIHAHELPYNELHDRGYPSIGCNTPTCTQPVQAGEHSRAGRWVNHERLECGLHTSALATS